MAVLHCVVTSPEGLIFEGNARSVVVPAVDGELGILPRHAPLIGALGYGEMRIEPAGGGSAAQHAGGKARYFVEGGFLQVLRNEVTVLATRAEPVSALVRAAEEEKLRSFSGMRPPKGAPAELVEEYQRKVRVARSRVKLAR